MFRENIITELFSNRRNIVKLAIDLVSVFIGIFLGLLIRYEDSVLFNIHRSYFIVYGVAFLAVYLIRKNGLKSWSYTNSLDVLNLTFTNLIALMITLSYYAVFRESYSRTVVLVGFVLVLMLQLLWRFFFRLNRSYKVMLSKNKPKMNTLIYGAGDAGVALIRDGLTNPNYPYHITAIVDDDRRKRGTYINGVKVFGDFYDLADVVREQSIEMVIIAIPTIKRERIKEIIDLTKCCADVKVKILPGLDEILQDENIANQVRDVSIEDLLGREQVLVNGDNIKDIIEDKVVFVTGGAGSIGSELARQIARYRPKKLVTIDVNENDLYFLELELKRMFKEFDLQSEICNIREAEKVELLFNRYRPNIVFHAAAHKHVPLMEHNPEEAIKNNIFGTKKVAEMAIKYGAERFVLISTDKAVNPTNIMGATKRACEIVVESMNGKSDTKFMAVRFGNVLGSNGSVIPIFKKLISEGKNLTLTHPDITRYFMTIPEAAQLVIEAGSLGKGGELFILDMGEPVRIIDLARTMIKLSNADVDIEIVGLRPGEKLYEELLYDVSAAIKTENNKIFITKIDPMDIKLEYHLEKLTEAIKNPVKENLKTLMKEFVITYKEVQTEVKG
ncbi:nucleoside-diphosphate sugar epimerase/dehydratase [Cetobacterium sp. ZOR0034]|uniref:polysaccharide biosynthesis protein n=1 Tax=Cetobacterium sp. ZOR0034 TaxID=1339239 RepID=UPI000AFE9677|nr:nucleoside-diphosphate sugar epimerase/dehydratase [Cetobacterium sp. ZOR0034]